MAQPSGPSNVARHSFVNITDEKSVFMYFPHIQSLCCCLRGGPLMDFLTSATSLKALQRVARVSLGISQVHFYDLPA